MSSCPFQNTSSSYSEISPPSKISGFSSKFSYRGSASSDSTAEEIEPTPTAVTYRDYLQLSTLLSLQSGLRSDGFSHPEENLFIVAHQSIELWFKQAIIELEKIRFFMENQIPGTPISPQINKISPDSPCFLPSPTISSSIHALNRFYRIFRFISTIYELIESMNPTDFLEFRDFLLPSSAFQSIQFREIEILMGLALENPERTRFNGKSVEFCLLEQGETRISQLMKRTKENSNLAKLLIPLANHWANEFYEDIQLFYQEFQEILLREKEIKKQNILLKNENNQNEINKNEINGNNNNNNEILNELEYQYKEQLKYFNNNIGRQFILLCFTFPHNEQFSKYYLFFDGLIRIEMSLLLWRFRHSRMAEGFIGKRMGSAGTNGIKYLDQTATNEIRIFYELNQIRSIQMAAAKFKFRPKS